MRSAMREEIGSGWNAGRRRRSFLSAELLFLLLIFGAGATRATAATCAALSDLSLSRMQGTVYGPSGVTVPQILVQVMQDGAQVGQTHTSERGKFQLKVPPGNYVVHIQFLGSRSMDLNVRIGHAGVDLFHTTRMRIVLGVSGARCSFATTSSKQFKDELRRYEQRLVEVPAGP